MWLSVKFIANEALNSCVRGNHVGILLEMVGDGADLMVIFLRNIQFFKTIFRNTQDWSNVYRSSSVQSNYRQRVALQEPATFSFLTGFTERQLFACGPSAHTWDTLLLCWLWPRSKSAKLLVPIHFWGLRLLMAWELCPCRQLNPKWNQIARDNTFLYPSVRNTVNN
jgi:hypothetical protein